MIQLLVPYCRSNEQGVAFQNVGLNRFRFHTVISSVKQSEYDKQIKLIVFILQ